MYVSPTPINKLLIAMKPALYSFANERHTQINVAWFLYWKRNWIYRYVIFSLSHTPVDYFHGQTNGTIPSDTKRLLLKYVKNYMWFLRNWI